MNTILNIFITNDNKFNFVITFQNNTKSVETLPFDRLKNSAENCGLNFEVNGRLLKPISFSVASKKEYNEVELRPGEKISMELIATIENIDKSYSGLSFTKATYEINFQERHKIWFSLNGYISEPVEMTFSPRAAESQ